MLKLEKVEEIMRSMADSRKLDKAIVADLFASKHEAYALVDSARCNQNDNAEEDK